MKLILRVFWKRSILMLWSNFGNTLLITLGLIFKMRIELLLFFQRVMDMVFVGQMTRFGDYGSMMNFR